MIVKNIWFLIFIFNLSCVMGTTTKDLIKKAVEIQQEEGSYSSGALKKYKEAISVYNKDKDDEYDYLYAHYQVMWIYSNMDKIENALPYAQKCMELLEKTIQSGAIFHFTDEGKFHEEVIRYATNVIAWYAYENTDNTQELEEALETISLGCDYAEDPTYFYVFDTKVRILLKLGRKDEAFRIVYDCLKKDPDFSDFRDLKRDRKYKEWLKNFKSGRVTQYSDTEKEFLEKAAKITSILKNKLSENKKNNTPFNQVIPEKEMSTIKDAKEKYKIPANYYDDNDYILIFKGDLYIKGNLDDKWYEQQIKGMVWKNDLWGIIIDGNLKVEGDITMDIPILNVVKDLNCDYLYSGDGHVLINGNADIEYGVYGYYNDGSLDIRGQFVTPYIIAYDHDMPRESDIGEFIYIEGSDGDDISDIAVGDHTGSGIGWNWHYFEDSEKLLSPSVLDEDYQFSIERFFDTVKKGENPFTEIKSTIQ